MDFLKLRAVNFFAIRDSGDLALKERGLVAILGENRDDTSTVSNGSGKSSIADALCWVNFGVTARGESGDSVINRVAKKGTYVELTMQDGDTITQIRRHRKDKTHKNATIIHTWNPAQLFDDGAIGTRIDKGTDKEVQLQINEILGCNYDVFKSSIYAGQEDMPDLPKMTDKPLKLLIEKAAGIERLESAYSIANRKLDEAEAAIAGEKREIESLEGHVVNWKASLAQAEANHAAFEAQRPAKQAHWVAESEKIGAAIREIFTSYKDLDEPKLAADKTRLEAVLLDHNKFTVGRNTLIRAEAEATRAHTIAQGAYERVRAQLVAAANAVTNAPAEMAKPCTECGKPHTADELDEFIAHQKTRARGYGVEAATAQSALTDAFNAAAKVSAQLVAFEATIPDVSSVTAELNGVNAKLGEAMRLKSNMGAHKVQYEACKTNAAAVLTEVNPAQSAIDMGKQQIAALEAKIEAVKSGSVALHQALDIAKSVVKVFSPAGVRAQILDTVTPFLNDHTSDYLSALSDGNLSAVWSTLATTTKGELREKFNIEVENATGADSFGGLSGGEKRKVRLATMLALQDLVASRASKPINIFIGDEIDDALDAAGLERLMTVLETKAREKGTVLIISHESLSDWCDQICTVTKEGGQSTISGALSV